MAIEKEKEKEKRSQGYPSRYRPKLYDKVTETLAGLGYTHIQMSEAIGISRQTFDVWRKENPSFAKAVIDGKGDADEVVIQSLYQRACGFCREDVHITQYQGKITETKYMKYYPPDATSCIFWLKNRDRENWSDRQVLAHTLADEDYIKQTPADIAKQMDNLTAPEPKPQIEGTTEK